MIALRTVLNNNGVFTKEKTIEQRRERYTLAVDPIEAFLNDAVAEDSVELDAVTKENFYQAYFRFCDEHKLAVQSKESLGKNLKKMHKFEEGRESLGERRTIWKGIKLTGKYNIELKQETLKVQ
jgi:hypothetical protein